MSDEQLSVEQRNKRTLKKLLIWAVAMFGFAFLMVPFYNVICDVTGLNGKTSSTAATQAPETVGGRPYRDSGIHYPEGRWNQWRVLF